MDSYVLLFAIVAVALLSLLQGISLLAESVGNASSRARRRLNTSVRGTRRHLCDARSSGKGRRSGW
jgi:hypothetical protein